MGEPHSRPADPTEWAHNTTKAINPEFAGSGVTTIKLHLTAADIDPSGDIWDEAQTDGRDLRFIQDGAEIPFHIVRWDKVNEQSQIEIFVDVTKIFTVR